MHTHAAERLLSGLPNNALPGLELAWSGTLLRLPLPSSHTLGIGALGKLWAGDRWEVSRDGAAQPASRVVCC